MPIFGKFKITVVSIGAIFTFKVIFTPLEYIPSKPPLSSYVAASLSCAKKAVKDYCKSLPI